MDFLANTQSQQRERLAFIEWRLLFFGEVKRQDLVDRFQVHGTAPTRDFKLYGQIAPENLRYDWKAKRYLPNFPFQPVFQVHPQDVLSSLAQISETPGADRSLGFPVDLPATLGQPDLIVLSALTRAIFRKQAVTIQYHSVSSGQTTREICPFALVDNGLRWHVRAFDRRTQAFRDFVVNRVTSVDLAESMPSPTEQADRDIQWQRIVELELVPHPNRPNPKATLLDYGISAPPLELKLRAATVGYTLRKWNVDCSENHSLKGDEVRLWLRNSRCLFGVETAVLAPGYSDGIAV